MDRLFGILSVRKSDLVIGRYIFILIMGFLSLVISLIAQPIALKVLGETISVFDIVTVTFSEIFLYALYTVFQILGYYKYGTIKGRIFMYIPILGFLVTLFLFPQISTDDSIMTIIINSPVLLITLVIILVFLMYSVSIWFSIRIMEHKEV